MKALTRRSLTLILALVMAFSLLPAAFAAEIGDFDVDFEYSPDGTSIIGLCFVFEDGPDSLDVADITELELYLTMPGAAVEGHSDPIDFVSGDPLKSDLGDSKTGFVVLFEKSLVDSGKYRATGVYADKPFEIPLSDVPQSAETEPEDEEEPDLPSDWAKEHVDALNELGLIPDELLSNFTSNINRAEFVALLWNIYVYAVGDIETPDEVVFSDIADCDYRSQILKAQSVGLAAGRGEYFDPSGILNREEMTIFINNLIKVTEGLVIPDADSTTFADNADISWWAVSHIAFCQNNDVLAGVGNNMFAPKRVVTREVAMAAMYNIIGVYYSDDGGEAEPEPEE